MAAPERGLPALTLTDKTERATRPKPKRTTRHHTAPQKPQRHKQLTRRKTVGRVALPQQTLAAPREKPATQTFAVCLVEPPKTPPQKPNSITDS